MEARGIGSLKEWDDQYSGTQSLFNWVQDFIRLLGYTGHDDRTFLEERRVVLETLLGLLPSDDLLRDNSRSDLAQTYFALGLPEKGEQLYRLWLEAKPTWGWGWIGWADCCYFFAFGREKDPARAEQILKQGLGVSGVEAQEHILERLRDLYEETGRTKEAKGVQAEMDRRHKPAPVKSAPPTTPLAAPHTPPPPIRGMGHARLTARVGRNDPCPCGSGKKYKKCCLRD
jgi:hypothetical protein